MNRVGKEPWLPALKDNEKPLYVRIADAIADDVLSGRLEIGERLPTLRELSTVLKVNYATVSRAFNEAQRRGYIYSRVGQGSFVSRPGSLNRGSPSRRASSAERVIDMTMNLPPEPEHPLLAERLVAGLRSLGSDLKPLMRYQEMGGSPEDKSAAVQWLQRRPLHVTEEQVLVIPGVQSGLLAILSNLTKPGDTILCERVTYPGLRAIAGQMGVRLVGMSLDQDGIDPDQLNKLISEYRPKAIYTNPVMLNPASVTLSEERRHRLVQVARQHNLPIIEDDAYGMLPTHAPSALAALAPELTYYLVGFSKTLGAGLRIAYLVVPSGRVGARLAASLRATTVMASPITASLASCWIMDGTADLALSLIRKESIARQKVAAEILGDADYWADPESFHVWLNMPPKLGRAAFAASMRSQGINVVVADAFATDTRPPDSVRLCLGGPMNMEQLTHSMHLIADALANPHSAHSGFF